MTKILVFTTSIEHTTHRKAAQMLSDNGAEVVLAGFHRNNFPSGQLKGVEVVMLGETSHGNYLNRFLSSLRVMGKIRSLSKKYDFIYCFTLDGFWISYISLLFLRGKKFIYQVQDIRPIFFSNSIAARFASYLERIALKKVSLLIVSSINYYTDYFKPKYSFPETKMVVIENKLSLKTQIDTRVEECREIEPSNKPITIGYFGVLRCKRSWQCLFDSAKEYPEALTLYIRGKPNAIPDIASEVSSFKNVYYGGLYKSPDDLEEIYSNVDIVWACYPFSGRKDGNWTMARTIRFYEAIAFNKPVIVQKGTAQEKDVLDFDIGLVIDMNEPDKVKTILKNLTLEDIHKWKINISKLPKSYAFHHDEHFELVNRIQVLKGKF